MAGLEGICELCDFLKSQCICSQTPVSGHTKEYLLSICTTPVYMSGDMPPASLYAIGEPYTVKPVAPPDEVKPVDPPATNFISIEPTQLELHRKAYEMACALAESQQKTIDALERTIVAQAKSIETLDRMVRLEIGEGEPGIE